MNGILNLLLGNALPADSGQAPAQPDIGTMVNDLWANSGNYSDSPSGRKQRMDAIQAALTKPISSQTTALLPGLLNLVDNLLDSVTNLLGNVLGVVTGDGCTTTVLGIPGGSTAGCKQILTNTLQHNQATSSGGVVSNALLAPLAQIIDLLNPLLNRIGEQVLQPTVTQLLGSDPGRVDVHLQSLQCHRVQLVY
jgi:hypothetical protein